MTRSPEADPKSHRRHSIRLEGYDYSQAGAYFITICTHERKRMFGEVVGGVMKLNKFGDIALDQWSELPDRFPNIELGEFVVMPNHIHGIIILHDSLVRAGFTPAHSELAQQGQAGGLPQQGQAGGLAQQGQAGGLAQQGQPQGLPQEGQAGGLPQEGQPQGLPLLGDIVGAYKSLVANACLEIFKSKSMVMGKLWQRNYWEHIIRDEKSLQAITLYIQENPAQWKKDQLFTGDRA